MYKSRDKIDRRSFLKGLTGAAATAAVVQTGAETQEEKLEQVKVYTKTPVREAMCTMSRCFSVGYWPETHR